MAKLISVLGLVILIIFAIVWFNSNNESVSEESSGENQNDREPLDNEKKEEGLHSTLTLVGEAQGGWVFSYTIHNDTNEVVTLPFNSGQKYEYYVKDNQGQTIRKYSEGKMFSQQMTEKVIEPGETYTERVTVSSLPPGKYQLEVELASSFKEKLKQTIEFESQEK